MAVERKYITYNQVHKLCQASAKRILEEFKPNLMVAYVSHFKAGYQDPLFADLPPPPVLAAEDMYLPEFFG